MRNGFFSEHWSDNGKPGGGVTTGRGFTISWQNGPLGRGYERAEPNGAFVEDIIAAAKERIECYQNGGFPCAENADAIAALEVALKRLDDRTKDREARAVEGTHAS
jgi:hypothetical protein